MPVDDGDRIEVLGTPVDVMLTEGHINGHISYLVGGALFCGDTPLWWWMRISFRWTAKFDA